METLKITLVASLIFLLSSPLWAQKNFRFDDYGFANLGKSGAMRTSEFRAELGLILPLDLDY